MEKARVVATIRTLSADVGQLYTRSLILSRWRPSRAKDLQLLLRRAKKKVVKPKAKDTDWKELARQFGPMIISVITAIINMLKK